MTEPVLPDEAAAQAAMAGEADEHPVHAWRVTPEEHGMRVDKALALQVPDHSRSHLQSLIALGVVHVDDKVCDAASRSLRAGQRVRIELVPTAQSQAFHPEPMDLQVLHEDAALMVINKPAGLVVHPAAGHWQGTLMNGLLAHHPGAMALPRGGLVHRLDKDTSGVMVVAKTLASMTALVRDLAARDVSREYLALAQGRPRAAPSANARAGDADDDDDEGFGDEPFTVDAPIGRDLASRIRMAVRHDGKPSKTDFKLLAQRTVAGLDVVALQCKLHTGRTHQIRVHAAWSGHPLLADALYGGPSSLGLTRQALHAWRLQLVHPVSGKVLAIQAPLPDDLKAAWKTAGGPAIRRLTPMLA